MHYYGSPPGAVIFEWDDDGFEEISGSGYARQSERITASGTLSATISHGDYNRMVYGLFNGRPQLEPDVSLHLEGCYETNDTCIGETYKRKYAIEYPTGGTLNPRDTCSATISCKPEDMPAALRDKADELDATAKADRKAAKVAERQRKAKRLRAAEAVKAIMSIINNPDADASARVDAVRFAREQRIV